MACGIYKIECLINKRIYVGQSIDVNRRWNEHRAELRVNIHPNKRLQNAWNKYGETEFNFQLIEECTKGLLNSREEFYMKHLNSLSRETGFNLTEKANSCLGYKHSEETKQNMSKSASSRANRPSWRKAHSKRLKKKWLEGSYDKVWTPETKKRLSEACKKAWTPERRKAAAERARKQHQQRKLSCI